MVVATTGRAVVGQVLTGLLARNGRAQMIAAAMASATSRSAASARRGSPETIALCEYALKGALTMDIAITARAIAGPVLLAQIVHSRRARKIAIQMANVSIWHANVTRVGRGSIALSPRVPTIALGTAIAVMVSARARPSGEARIAPSLNVCGIVRVMAFASTDRAGVRLGSAASIAR